LYNENIIESQLIGPDCSNKIMVVLLLHRTPWNKS